MSWFSRFSRKSEKEQAQKQSVEAQRKEEEDDYQDDWRRPMSLLPVKQKQEEYSRDKTPQQLESEAAAYAHNAERVAHVRGNLEWQDRQRASLPAMEKDPEQFYKSVEANRQTGLADAELRLGSSAKTPDQMDVGMDGGYFRSAINRLRTSRKNRRKYTRRYPRRIIRTIRRKKTRRRS